MASTPDLYINHGYGHRISNPSVNTTAKEKEGKEKEKEKGHSHVSESHEKLAGKGGKKRCRAPKKKKTSPTTFLAADPSNFRAMVQHLTGFSSSSSSSSSSSFSPYLYGHHGIDVSSSTSFLNPPHPNFPLYEQPKREMNIYSPSPFHMTNPSVSVSTPLFINPPSLPPTFQYGNESSLMREENTSLPSGDFILDELDHLQLFLHLGNTNNPSSPSLHLHNNNNLDSFWLSDPSLV